MRNQEKTYRSERAIENIYRISAAIAELRLVTVVELAAAVGMSKSSMGGYLREMARRGLVHCAVPANTTAGCSALAKWAQGREPLDRADCEAGNDDELPRKAVVYRKYPPHNVRDELVAALFGKAA